MSISFQELNLIEPLLRSIAEEGYTEPTDIQAQTIPVVLGGYDLMASAQTGTGKSAAFCLPLLQQIQEEKSSEGHTGIRALILAPTRELAVQIEESLSTYGRHTDVNHTAIFGGIPRKVQIDHLSREIDILVATPGRLVDMIEREHVCLDNVSRFVLDEADQMLNLGFIDDVKKVIGLMPEKRQTLLFSATIPNEIAALAQTILHEPVRIAIAPEKATTPNVSQHLYWVDEHDKPNLLLHLLSQNRVESAFVFTATRQGADKVADFLCRAGYKAEAIHSERSQKERGEALQRFRDREVTLLVATDVVARGIDVDQVSHVFNLDLPQEPESYVHRIGRTGRAGNEGVANTFCDPASIEKMRKIEKLIGKKIDVEDTHPYMTLALRRKLADQQEKADKKRKSSGQRHRRR